MSSFPYLGFGLGLRTEHYSHVIENRPKVDWFEVITENFLVDGGRPLHYLEQVRENYPIAMHGVSLSIGSCDPLNQDYLTKLKNLAKRIDPVWVSDHLCWTGINGLNMHDLLPLPYTEEALNHVVNRVSQVQEFLGRKIMLENVSSYVTYLHSHMTEWEFLAEVAKRADCNILLDVNNIFVSAFNHDFKPEEYLNYMPVDRVKQFHLAGHLHCEKYIIDTHDSPIVPGVWELYHAAVKRFGKVSTMIERDDNIPEFDELLAELNQAKNIAQKILQEKTYDCVA